MTPVSADYWHYSKLATRSWQCPKAIGTKQEGGIQSSPMRFPGTVVGVDSLTMSTASTVVIVDTLANVNSNTVS